LCSVKKICNWDRRRRKRSPRSGISCAGRRLPTDLPGGAAAGKVPTAAPSATIFAEFASGALKPVQLADLALGARLRTYSFDLYKTKRKEGEERPSKAELNFACSNPVTAEKAWARTSAIADGVVLARDLINEPANVLYPGEFARRASARHGGTACRRAGLRA
jgi:leucyl aminopeptidase